MKLKVLVVSLLAIVCIGCGSITKGSNNNHYLTNQSIAALPVGTHFTKVDAVLGTKAKNITDRVANWNNTFIQDKKAFPPGGYAWIFTRHDVFKPSRWYVGFIFDSSGRVVEKAEKYIK